VSLWEEANTTGIDAVSAIHEGHVDVAQNEVEVRVQQCLAALYGILGDLYRIAGLRQMHAQQGAKKGIVIDDENARFVAVVHALVSQVVVSRRRDSRQRPYFARGARRRQARCE
jgi:hypothetical protein